MEAAIQNYETAYRMQTAVPEPVDLRGESDATKKLYGMDLIRRRPPMLASVPRPPSRRAWRPLRRTLPCRPSRACGGNSWDQHGNLRDGYAKNAFIVDQPIGALVQDLGAWTL